MGKWSEWAKGKERVVTTEPKYQERVEETKQQILLDSSSLNDLLQKYQEWRKIHDERDKAKKASGLVVEALRQIIEGVFADAGIESLKTEDGGRVRTQLEPYAKIVDPVAFKAWCQQSEYASEMTLPWSRVNAIVKGRLEDGEEIPEGVDVKSISKLFYTAPKTTKGENE